MSQDDKIIIQILLVGTIIGLVAGLFIGRFLISKPSEPIIYEQGDMFIRAIPDLEEWYYTELMGRIIYCESRGNPEVCNKQYGCRAGQGLCQLIPSTVKYCEKKLGKKIDPFNREDNLECGMWLLKNEGTYHWGYKGASWGSFKCWNE